MLKGKKVLVPGFWNRCMLQITRLLPLNFKIRQSARMFRRELLEEK
jgi:hypothetical protein